MQCYWFKINEHSLAPITAKLGEIHCTVMFTLQSFYPWPNNSPITFNFGFHDSIRYLKGDLWSSPTYSYRSLDKHQPWNSQGAASATNVVIDNIENCVYWTELNILHSQDEIGFKVAPNSFQYLSWDGSLFITWCYNQWWYQKTSQSLVNTLSSFFWHHRST